MTTWFDLAACNDSDPALFFPVGEDERAERLPKAQAVCASCPVSEPCEEFALATRQQFGVWGGHLFDGVKHPRRVVESPCALCGSSTGHKYCSAACKNKAYRERNGLVAV